MKGATIEQVLQNVATDFGMPSLPNGMYGDYAKEVATRWCSQIALQLTQRDHKADLYDEVWCLARELGYSNVTDAITAAQVRSSALEAGLRAARIEACHDEVTGGADIVDVIDAALTAPAAKTIEGAPVMLAAIEGSWWYTAGLVWPNKASADAAAVRTRSGTPVELIDRANATNLATTCAAQKRLIESLRKQLSESYQIEPPVKIVQGTPIQLAAVAVMRDDGDGGLRPEWVLEGGTSELFEGDTLLVADDRNLCAEDGSAEVYHHPEQLTVGGRSMNFLRCEFHGDSADDCEKYSGRIPCEPEITMSTVIADADYVVADSGSATLYNQHTLEQLKELSKTIEFADGLHVSGKANKVTALLTCATAVPELVARIEQLEHKNG